MKTIIVVLLAALTVTASGAKADDTKATALHDMHMIMRFMDHAMCVALEGADFQMLGEMSSAGKLDRESIVHGTIMLKDGPAMINEMLEGKAMRELYKEGNFDKALMDDLHELGKKMLEVIDLVEKIHGNALRQAAGK
jgi:hypothetical protein